MRIFEHVKLPQLQFDLNAETTDSGRVYTTPEGNKYKSITTVLSHYGKQAIYEWRQSVGEERANEISRKAANRGTKVHKICEDYLNNEITELKMQMMMPDLKELFSKIRSIIDANVGRIYSQEQALYSDEYRIAGRVDLIAEWNGKLAVIDFKTSSKQKEEENIQNYFMQCTAYALMFSERTGMWIDDIVVLIATEEGPAQVFERQIHDYRQSLVEYIDKYA
jgi:genome maintenance exonuclease 1